MKRDLSKFFNAGPVRLKKPIISWRAWGLSSEERRIMSLTAKIDEKPRVWDGPVMTTRILPSGYLARPTGINHKLGLAAHIEDFGVYSYKDPYTLVRYLQSYGVYGRIENYGHVIEHELGYRAQKVIVQELWIAKFVGDDFRKELEKVYGCPVGWIESLQLAEDVWSHFSSWWPSQQEEEWLKNEY